MSAIVDAYEQWSCQVKEEGNPDTVSPLFDEEPEGFENIILFDTHSKFSTFLCPIFNADLSQERTILNTQCCAATHSSPLL